MNIADWLDYKRERLVNKMDWLVNIDLKWVSTEDL